MKKTFARRLPYTLLRHESAEMPIANPPPAEPSERPTLRPEDSTNIVQWLLTKSPIERKI